MMKRKKKEKKNNFSPNYFSFFEAYLGIMELSWCHGKFVNVTVQGLLIAQSF